MGNGDGNEFRNGNWNKFSFPNYYFNPKAITDTGIWEIPFFFWFNIPKPEKHLIFSCTPLMWGKWISSRILRLQGVRKIVVPLMWMSGLTHKRPLHKLGHG